MIKIKRFFYILILSLLTFVCVPLNIKAASTSYVSVNSQKTITLRENGLTFTRMSFNNFNDNGIQIGMSGVVTNTNDYPVSYLTKTYLYNSFRKILGVIDYEGTIPGGTQYSYSDLRDASSVLGDINPEEIAYYVFELEIIDYNPSGNVEEDPDYDSNLYYLDKDYYIDGYDINIIVNENNTFDITENITAYFNVPKHGIYRKIPLKNTIYRLDGTTSKNRTQITNLSVDNEYTTRRENGNYVIQIGSKNHTLTGKQTYVIKYTYNLGKDPIKGYDELYYNIIGNEWDTVINNVTFTITMPKGFDKSKLGFSSGKTGSTDNSKVKYNVSGNKITGSYNGVLKAGEALTVRCELEEGYFVGAGLTFNIMEYFFFLIPIVFLGITALIWYKFGRDEKPVVTVEFYPPEGFNSLEVGFLYKGKAYNQDVISLLIYLANKGYIKITETEEKSLFTTSKGFKITKLKEYDGNNISEQLFLKGLFTKKPSSALLFSKESDHVENDKNEVTSLDLYDNFYITMNKILSKMNNKENKNKIFSKKASSKFKFIVLMIIVTYCLITIPPVLNYGKSETLLFALLFPGIGFSVILTMLFGKQTSYGNGNAVWGVLPKIFGIFWGVMFGGIPWSFLVLPALLQDPIYLIGYVVGLLCVLGMIIFLKYLPKRTQYGNEILGKLLGFKNFLETAEKDRLEAMVMQDPTYFYNILPYTYVLGVSDTWIKKFETISLQAPSWYDGPSTFDMVTFSTFMSNTMTSAQIAMSSSPSSSSSGGEGSSGGGSSGGGSGGGGGGSW